MDEQKSMSRDEMVVGSYVCSMHMNGMEGEVVRVEFDERGPEYDLLHVQMNDWELPQRCQRVVMMLAERPDAEPAPAPAHQCEDSSRGLMRERDDLRRALNEAIERANKDAEDLEALRADYAALGSTFNEINAAYNKTHESLASEIANHEAADKLARKLSDERHALRAKIASMEASENAEIERLRELLQQVQEAATSNLKALRFAQRDVAMHQRRAQSWQGAAADALSQLEDLRASRAGEGVSRG